MTTSAELLPKDNCGCSCHSFPGIRHIVPCCDAPAYKETVEYAIDSLSNVDRELVFHLLGPTNGQKERLAYAQRADARRA